MVNFPLGLNFFESPPHPIPEADPAISANPATSSANSAILANNILENDLRIYPITAKNSEMEGMNIMPLVVRAHTPSLSHT